MKMASSQSEPISHSMRFPKNGSSTLRLFFFSGEGGTQTALNKNGGLSSLSNAVMLEKDIFGWSHQTPFALRALFLSHLRERQHWRNPSGVVHCRLRIRICIGYPQSQLGLFVWSARSDQHPNDARACTTQCRTAVDRSLPRHFPPKHKKPAEAVTGEKYRTKPNRNFRCGTPEVNDPAAATSGSPRSGYAQCRRQ